ncbi:MAG: glutamine-hydrolyzing GMP synthase [bacterium]
MDKLLVLSLNFKHNQLLARKIREMNIYCELHPVDITIDFVKQFNPQGVVFYSEFNLDKSNLPETLLEVFNLKIPILGICPKGGSSHEIFAAGIDLDTVKTIEKSDVFLNFLFKTCSIKADWNMENYAAFSIEEIKNQVKDKKVILGLSGGVDSSVVAALLAKAVGKNLTAIFVDTGLLRKNEREEVEKNFSQILNLVVVDAKKEFLDKLAKVEDPEQKRKVIGSGFIEVFEREAAKIKDADFLAQGTIYPDVIESLSEKNGKSLAVKSHHNVGGLPEKMKLKLVEPLRNLFKSEVRKLGLSLGLPENLINRHPFPGPGLAVRVLGEVTEKRCDILREADYIFIEEIRKAGLYNSIAQAFAVFLPIKSVGVVDGKRAYEFVISLRAVKTDDFMVADWYEFEAPFLKKVSSRIIREVESVSRVVYDISSKPPATIEWE